MVAFIGFAHRSTRDIVWVRHFHSCEEPWLTPRSLQRGYCILAGTHVMGNQWYLRLLPVILVNE